jgi:hypothetical protein
LTLLKYYPITPYTVTIMLTLSAAAAAVSGYLAKVIKDNKSIHEFFNDFTDASVAWMRPIFLKDGDIEKNILKELKENPDDVAIQGKIKTLIENQAENDGDTATNILNDMVKTITEKLGTSAVPANEFNTSITGGQNTVIQGVSGGVINVSTTTHSGTGDIVSGDKVVNNNTYYGGKPLDDGKNAVWKKMLHQGNISDALEYLVDAYKNDADKSNTLILLLSRHARNETYANKGTITDESANLERNKIVSAIVEEFGKEV